MQNLIGESDYRDNYLNYFNLNYNTSVVSYFPETIRYLDIVVTFQLMYLTIRIYSSIYIYIGILLSIYLAIFLQTNTIFKSGPSRQDSPSYACCIPHYHVGYFCISFTRKFTSSMI